MKQKPYQLLLWTALVFLFISFFNLGHNKSVDIHTHDTYIVIAHAHVFWSLAILAVFVWVLYLLTRKVLYSKALTWIHVIVTILTLLLVVMTMFHGNDYSRSAPIRFDDTSTWNSFYDNAAYAKAVGITLFVLLCGQLVFVVNFMAGLVKTLTGQKN